MLGSMEDSSSEGLQVPKSLNNNVQEALDRVESVFKILPSPNKQA